MEISYADEENQQKVIQNIFTFSGRFLKSRIVSYKYHALKLNIALRIANVLTTQAY